MNPTPFLLDFWIGDWDAFETDTPNGPSEARAHVDAIAQGCAIHELYEQSDGLIGESILSYDPCAKAGNGLGSQIAGRLW